ncbi:MAG: hypothetical protein L6U99_11180 [Clostridium sp.]|nr:MAG: hypothetical protein L6U99_11180 [Clostridium sp.]
MGITRDDKSRVDIISLISENAHDPNYAKRYMETTYLNLIKKIKMQSMLIKKAFFEILLTKDEGVFMALFSR